MHCEELRNQFTNYLADSLDSTEHAAIDDHLMACESCRDEFDALKTIWVKLGEFPGEVPDSEAMRARFSGMLEAYRQGMQQAPHALWWDSVNSWIGAWWPRKPVLQFGIALLLFVAGAVYADYFRSPATVQNSDLNQLQAELRETRQLVALSLMQQQSASERLRGVRWSNRIEDPGAEMLSALLDTLSNDPNVNVRLAAVEALKKFGESQFVRRGALEALARQESPLMQVALIDLMVELQERESMETLRRFVGDTTINEGVRQRATWGLEQFQ